MLLLFCGDFSSEMFLSVSDSLGLVDKILTATHCISLLDIAVRLFNGLSFRGSITVSLFNKHSLQSKLKPSDSWASAAETVVGRPCLRCEVCSGAAHGQTLCQM